MKRKTDSSNPNLDHSSDSSFEEYYLYENRKDRKPSTLIDGCLVDTSENGFMSWNSDSVQIANFLKEMNEKLGMNIPIDMDDISKKLKRADEKLKKMSKMYQNQIQNEKRCKRLRSSIKRLPRKYSSLSTPETSPPDDSHVTRILDMATKNNVVENPNQEAPAPEDQAEIQTTQNSNSDTTTRSSTSVVANPNQEQAGMENPNQENANPNQEQAAIENPNQEEGHREMRSVLFTSKQLTKTDVDPHQHRLAMPRSKVDDRVITMEEKEKLENNNSVAAKLIDPQNRIYDICLRLKKTQGSSYSYAIGKPWNEIKDKNGFKEAMQLDVRCFRGEEAQLYFVLERVPVVERVP